MSNAKHAVLKKNIDGVIYDLMIKTNTDSIVLEDGETTLATYLLEHVDTNVQTPQLESAITKAIADLIAGAPEEFQTLKQIYQWIDNHEIEYRQLKLMQDNKVDKIEGKGLSEEDFTTVLKTKVERFEIYEHPASHSADIIEETAARQFMTMEEKELLHTLAEIVEESILNKVAALEATVTMLEETIGALNRSLENRLAGEQNG